MSGFTSTLFPLIIGTGLLFPSVIGTDLLFPSVIGTSIVFPSNIDLIDYFLFFLLKKLYFKGSFQIQYS